MHYQTLQHMNYAVISAPKMLHEVCVSCFCTAFGQQAAIRLPVAIIDLSKTFKSICFFSYSCFSFVLSKSIHVHSYLQALSTLQSKCSPARPLPDKLYWRTHWPKLSLDLGPNYFHVICCIQCFLMPGPEVLIAELLNFSQV